MLEEALRNEKSHPSEIALAMLSFIQNELPAGGSAADSRFFDLYGPLCERIFGPILGPQDGFRHKDGGWLSAQSPWTRLPSAAPPSPRTPLGPQIGSTVNLSRTSASALDAEPVVKLLGTAGNPRNSKDPLLPTLVEALSKESDNRPGVAYALRIDALPKSIQDAWFALVEASMGGKPADCSVNDHRLLGTLLRKRPEEQNQLKLFRQRAAQKQQQDPLRQPLHLSPRGFDTPSQMQISPSARSVQSPLPTKKSTEEAPPNAMLSMLENYLFLYLRFPLAAPDRNRLSTSSSSSVTGVNLHRVSVPSSSIYRAQREAFGDALYYHIFRRYMRHFLPYEREDDRWIDFTDLRESELFLRILIAMWIESRARIIPTPKVVQTINEHRQNAGLDAPNLDLNNSYDLVQQVELKYQALPSLVRKCLRALIIHAVLDPAISRNIMDKDLTARSWCLSTCMTALQQPVYNLVRTAFRYGSIHTPDSSFFGTLNTWLIWLEPWNLTETRKHDFSAKNAKQRIMGNEPTKNVSRALSLPRYNHASKYQAAWEPYIAANVFMYTIPLAIFLRRARELDFSAGKFERSIEIVKRVFRVFSPEVVDAVSRHLDGSQSSRFSHLVTRHREVLGEYGPPQGSMSLSSLKTDMQSLLEEIDMQHLKKVRELNTLDWMVGKVEGLFGKGVVSGEEKKLESLVERAKLIARLPIDYDILQQSSMPSWSGRSDAASADKFVPARTEDGTLSDLGREQVFHGGVKCSLSTIKYSGDKMRARVQSHELPFLVHFTIWASDALNKKFVLSGKEGTFRFNLRFLADYRNAAFFIITLYLLFKIIW